MTINDVFENFIYKHKVKGNKGNTRVNYYYHLLPFFKFLGNEYQIEDITTETVLEYVDTLPDLKKKNGDNYSEGSLSSFLRTLEYSGLFYSTSPVTRQHDSGLTNSAAPVIVLR